jgi:hypothetical protein
VIDVKPEPGILDNRSPIIMPSPVKSTLGCTQAVGRGRFRLGKGVEKADDHC